LGKCPAASPLEPLVLTRAGARSSPPEPELFLLEAQLCQRRFHHSLGFVRQRRSLGRPRGNARPIINANPFGFQRVPATVSAMQTKLTERRKKVFLAELARHGIIVRAARAASPRASGQYGAVRTFKDERDRDPEFAAQWQEAVEAAEAAIEHEIYRRAMEGVEEPIYAGKYREKIVGTVRRYSDPLLMFRARALLPAYRETQAISVNKHVTHNVDAGVLGDAVAKVAQQMAENLRPQLPAPARVIDHE